MNTVHWMTVFQRQVVEQMLGQALDAYTDDPYLNPKPWGYTKASALVVQDWRAAREALCDRMYEFAQDTARANNQHIIALEKLSDEIYYANAAERDTA